MSALLLRDQASAVRAGDLDAEQLLEAALGRREEVDQVLNSIVALAPESAVSNGGGEGPLAGAPIAVKDQFALPWWAPQDAIAVPSPYVGQGESAVHRNLSAAGASVFAVANMQQLAIGSTGLISTYGPCANPWDPSRCAGGSSSGSAAAVSAGIVAASVGTDGAGSIRIPAAYCGLTGLKPTYGAVAVEGYTAAKTSLAVIGPIARDAADCRLLAEALQGEPLRAADVPRPTIWVPERAFWGDLQPAVERRCRAALERFQEAGCRLRPVELPAAELTPIAAMLCAGVERIARIDRDWLDQVAPHLDPRVRAVVKGNYLTSSSSLELADRLRAFLRHELKRLFGEVDVLAWPTVPAPAPARDHPRVELPVSGEVSADTANLRLNALANLTGIPAVSIPCGLVEGLPVGLTLHAAWGRDPALLDLAELFERGTDRVFVDARPRPLDLTANETKG